MQHASPCLLKMTTYPEERVLRPLDPIPDDVNDWPDFALREVKVFYQGKGRYADLLEASDAIPLCVLGELMPLDDELEHRGTFDSSSLIALLLGKVSPLGMVNFSTAWEDGTA